MSKPLGISKSDKKESRARKNPKMAEVHAEQRKAKTAERPKQVWSVTEQAWIR
jgi:hypothetical protein